MATHGRSGLNRWLLGSVAEKVLRGSRNPEVPMVELTVYTPEMPWEVLSFIPGEAEVKILRAEPEGGARTMLVRLPAGGEISPQNYLGVVQYYVLEGEYETGGETFGVGTYRLLPAHASVGTLSLDFAVLLVATAIAVIVGAKVYPRVVT